MGIKINVGMKQDYSYLFQGLSSGSGGMGNLNFLSDYASIKNGSYGKLMKAYYGGGQNSGTASAGKKSNSSDVVDRILEENKNPKISKEAQEANTKLTTGLSSLNTSVSALRNEKTYTDTNGVSAADKTAAAVKNYVSNYNDVVNAAKGSTLRNKTAYVANMMSATAANADKLSEIGVTINSNGTLSLNEEKLKAAGVSKVQELFSAKDITSYGSTIASRVQFAGGASASASTDAAGSTQTNNTAGSNASTLKADARKLASEELYAKIKDKDGNETDQYDIANIFATAKSFVSNYNKLFDTAGSSSNSGAVANLSYIREKTARSADTLKQFGISVDYKGRMKIDEDTFKKADMSKVQRFFKEYGSSVATNASLVDFYMTTQANSASGYTADGGYNVQGNFRYEDTI